VTVLLGYLDLLIAASWGPIFGIWGPPKSWGPRQLPTLPTPKAGPGCGLPERVTESAPLVNLWYACTCTVVAKYKIFFPGLDGLPFPPIYKIHNSMPMH